MADFRFAIYSRYVHCLLIFSGIAVFSRFVSQDCDFCFSFFIYWWHSRFELFLFLSIFFFLSLILPESILMMGRYDSKTVFF